MNERKAVPWQVPAAGSPTARELRLVREWGQLASKAVAQSLSGLGACPIACSLVGATVTDQLDAWASYPVSFGWGAPGPQWYLRLSVAAAEDVLAGLLGCQRLAPRESWSAIDRAILLVQVSELGQRVAADLQLPASSDHQVSLPPDNPPPLPPLVADLELQLRVHDRTHELHLLTGFAGLRQHLDRAASAGRALTTEVLNHATVDIEAVLPGPELPAGDLLQLQAGDVLLLSSEQQEAVLRAGGVVIGRGRAGARNGRLAVNLREVSNLPQKPS
ncbi:MAG: FliM/FliN family flagellar motor switch protein [Bacteroidota bacterium]